MNIKKKFALGAGLILSIAASSGVAQAADPFNKFSQQAAQTEQIKMIVVSQGGPSATPVVKPRLDRGVVMPKMQSAQPTTENRTTRIVRRIVQPVPVHSVLHTDCDIDRDMHHFNKMNPHLSTRSTTTPVFYSERSPT